MPGVVRVDVPVEIEREGLRVSEAEPVDGSPPPPQAERPSARAVGRAQERPPDAREARIALTFASRPRLSQVMTLRSISVTSAKRTIAIAESTTIGGEHPGRQQLACAEIST